MRDPIPTWCIALAVVHDGAGRFLLIQELDGTWFFPAGLMRAGETWPQAMARIAWEEAGVGIALQGIVRMEHRPTQDGARLRVAFLAQPLEGATPKSAPDEHSLGARWFALGDLAGLKVRNNEVLRLLLAVVKGAPIYSLDVLQVEGEVPAEA